MTDSDPKVGCVAVDFRYFVYAQRSILGVFSRQVCASRTPKGHGKCCGAWGHQNFDVRLVSFQGVALSELEIC